MTRWSDGWGSHSPTIPSLHLRHSSFTLSNPFVASPASQLMIQPFHRFTYVTAHLQPFCRVTCVTGTSSMSPGEPAVRYSKYWSILQHIFTSEIETFVIRYRGIKVFFYLSVVEVCHLRLEPLWKSSPPLCHSENANADRTEISWGVRKDGNYWARGPDHRVDDD